jgi:hypothetical protein
MRDPTLKNDLVVKFVGKAEIPSELQIGKNYLIHATGTITAFTEADKNDGTHVIYYRFEPVHIDMIDERGEKIKLKDPRKNSQKIRNFLWKVWSQNGYVEDFESVYDESTFVIMSRAESIVADAIKRIQNRT